MTEDTAATGTTINLSLVSHTNVGKTTLVRTLLAQDVGEVRDAAHITDTATGYVMLQAGSDTLMLWDTPGFGDTTRLLRRLRQSGNPIGWFLTVVWDRFRERALWSSQQAVRNVRDHADVVLYLVNAAEDPADAGYVGLEMEILAWIDKPVLVLLNQLGAPQADADEEVERWRRYLAATGVVRDVLTMDAFARCWVQESTLLAALKPLVMPDREAALARLSQTWQDKNLDRFHRSMRILAQWLAAAAIDREPVPERDWRDRVGDTLKALRQEEPAETRRAMGKLAERLEAGTRSSTEQLIEANGLSGRATREVLRRLRDDYASSGPAREGYAAVLGGLMSGAVGGLAADIAAGGLTLGGGMLVGGLLGALGASGIARTYNLARGDDGEAVRWSELFFTGLVRSALLRYLAVAHFGRGRGDWEEGEHPAFWQEAIKETLQPRRAEIRAAWEAGRGASADELAGRLTGLLEGCAAHLLVLFYPQARTVLTGGVQPDEAVSITEAD
ncbi:GTPase domain-containing protein [Sphingomonas sp. CFBP 13720]|uniref:GTPase domain-containing protein n=1 Tax=Sphingomonas sp. CFBP 13720 TaxID=2775302 RepID=UPI001782318D|nr:GTPase domain-containing protein [Sphingomonas sp. CFBP 13720]MBD8680075.1 GTPase domain-containing protein [Sphingomonas sp. CFBP 13720]